MQPAAPPQPPRLGKKTALVLLFGVLIFIGLVAWGDVRSVGTAVRAFNWAVLPGILALVLYNYTLRFLKWQWYLRLSGVAGIPAGESLRIFLAGLAMTITPGRVGELLKAYLLFSRHGVPVARTAPIVLAERLTDGFGLLILASGGLLLFRQGWLLLAVLAAAGIAGVAVLQYRPLWRWAVPRMAQLPVLKRYGSFVSDFYEHTATLLAPGPLAAGSLIGALSWAGEGLALYLVYVGLGVPSSTELAVQGLFVLSITTLAGLAAFVPGGLGVTDGTMAGLSRSLVGLSREGAAAATLLVRLCTLWFGVVLGWIALASLARSGREPGSHQSNAERHAEKA